MEDTNPEAVELVETLRRLRAACGNPTLEKIGRGTGHVVSTATLSRLFAGKVMPSRHAVMATASALLEMGTQAASGRQLRLREVGVLYDRAKRTQRTQRAQPPGLPGRMGWGPAGRPPKMPDNRLQEQLWELLRERGFTLRELARRTGVGRSTLSDALSGARLPSPYLVSRIAEACQVPREPLLLALRDLEQARQAERRAAEAHTGPAQPPPAPAAPRPPVPGSEGSSFVDIFDVFVRAAVSRPPAEIADLVAGLQVLGEGEFAARIVQMAAGTRSVADVTALALALLAADPAAEPRLPVQAPRPPAGSPTPPAPGPVYGAGSG
ncbi:helix-turn-helix transcriptional regulator [Streptomyces sp. NPDC049949]|uniref:helix-turn-helix domain-containing protein n=1 Tax=Streptomyces sp. NPDC049949 TaxID=3154627 RepID=UPI00341CB5F7